VLSDVLKKIKNMFHRSLLLFVDDDVKVKKIYISMLLMDIKKIISIEVIVIINL